MDDFGLKVGRYNAAGVTLVDGQPQELQLDSEGKLLVQADVTVVTDFLGLNGAADSSNILVVGTEDGTSGGTPHAFRLASNGAVIIDDGGSSITVDATDLDIRDLTSASDSVAAWLSDGSGNTISSTAGALDVNIASGATTEESVYVEGSAHSDGVDKGTFILGVNPSDEYEQFSIDADGDLLVHDTDALAKLTEIDNVLDTIYTEQLDQGTTLDSIDSSLGGTLDVNITNANVEVTQGTDPWVIGDGGNSITVDATDLDIRDLSASQDNVAISDGTDTLEINSDGSINVNADVPFDEDYQSSDLAGNGQVAVTGTFTTVASLSIPANKTAYIYGWQFDCDKNAVGQLTDGTNTYKVRLNSSAMPGVSEHFSEGGRIEIPGGGGGLTLNLQVRRRSAGAGGANASGAIHARVEP